MLRMNLDPQGYIKEIGYNGNYQYAAPSFIGFNSNMRCINVSDINNVNSWVQIELTSWDIITADEVFCRQFTKEIFHQLRLENLTNTQRVTLLGTIQVGMNALAWGDAEVARAAFNSITTTTLWTTVRKNWVLAQIDSYLNQ